MKIIQLLEPSSCLQSVVVPNKIVVFNSHNQKESDKSSIFRLLLKTPKLVYEVKRFMSK